MTTHPSVAGAAVVAGLMVAGGSYAARHDVGLGNGVEASAAARVRLEQELPLGRQRHANHHLLTWHPPHVPKIDVHHTPPSAPVTVAAPATSTVAAAPVTRTSPAAPVTRTSPVGGDDGGGDD